MTTTRPSRKKPIPRSAPKTSSGNAAQQRTVTGPVLSGSKGRMILVVSAVAVIAVAAAIVVVARSGGGSSSTTTRTATNTAGAGRSGKFRFAVGDPGPGVAAPPVVLTSTMGTVFDLSKERGKGVLLYFQEGIGCQPCWDQMRDFATAAAGFKTAGVDELVTITVNPVELLARKRRQDGVGGIVLADPDLTVSKAYHANQYGMMGDSTDGHTFIFVDPAGIIRWRADYGGSPDFTMYVPPANLLADLRAGLGLPPTP